MTTTKHTPGPWTVGKDGDVWAANGTHCVHVVPDTLDGPANARLIAAAPDMYDELADTANALSRILKRSDLPAVPEGMQETLRRLLADIHAAMYKATEG